MRSKIIFSLLVLAMLSTACGVSPISPASQPVDQPISQHPLITPDPNATATPTPFQPANQGGEATQEPEPQTTPTETSVPPTPTTVPLINRLPRPAGQVNILILGSDWRPNAGYRTDVIMLLSLNTKKGTASLISFPRDLYVDIPGWEMQRINTAQAHGGFELTQKTFELNFGVHPDHYIMTNFAGFKGIIDTLGGVDVYATKSLSDKCDLPQKFHDGYCNVDPGWVHMDGETALWYSRARYSTSDFDRTRRGQEVIQAIFRKLISLNAVTRAPELFNQFKSSVETDMSLADMLPLLGMATQLKDLKGLNQYFITYDHVTPWKTPEGAQVLVPNTEAIWKMIAEACYEQ